MVTILVVDDDAAVAESIKSLNPSWHVIKAQSGIKALDLLRGRNDFGLIILDIHIPDIDGYDLCLCIRAALPMIPILPYTNLHDDPNLAQYMHLARCCPPVYKGTSPENLLQAIERALELRVPSIASDALAVWNRLTQKAALAEAVARQQLLTGVRVVIFGTSLLHQWALQSLVATITQTHIIATVSTLEEFRQVRVTAAVDLLIASGADYTVLAGVRQQLPIPILFIAATLGEGRALATALVIVHGAAGQAGERRDLTG